MRQPTPSGRKSAPAIAPSICHPFAAKSGVVMRLFVIVVCSLAAAGCAYGGKQVSVEAPALMKHSAAKDGVVVGARPYFDPDEAEEVFGHPVVFVSRTVTSTSHGYLPVMVSLTNDSDDVMVIDKERTRLISYDGKRARPHSWQRMYAMFEPSVAAMFLTLGIVGAVAQDDANQDMAADWRNKELPDNTLILPHSAGNGGFLYFKDKGGQAPYLLRVALSRSSTGERIFVNVLIDPKRS